MKEKLEQLQKFVDEMRLDESEGALEEEIHLKRQEHYEIENRLCIQKVELAYLIHLIHHPFDKNRLSTFGSFEQKQFSQYCSRQLFHPHTSPIFFRPVEKSDLTRQQIRNLSPSELYEAIF